MKSFCNWLEFYNHSHLESPQKPVRGIFKIIPDNQSSRIFHLKLKDSTVKSISIYSKNNHVLESIFSLLQQDYISNEEIEILRNFARQISIYGQEMKSASIDIIESLNKAIHDAVDKDMEKL